MIINLENNNLISRAYYVKASLETANGSINYQILAITNNLGVAKKVIKNASKYYKNFEIYAGDFLADNLADIMSKGELIWRAPTKEELQAVKEFDTWINQFSEGLITHFELANNLIELAYKLPKFDINFLD